MTIGDLIFMQNELEFLLKSIDLSMKTDGINSLDIAFTCKNKLVNHHVYLQQAESESKAQEPQEATQEPKTKKSK